MERKIEKTNNNIEKLLNINEVNYILKIYISKNNSSIIFKIEQKNIQTFYFYEKCDLRDLQKMNNKMFVSNKNIEEAFYTLKQLIEKSTTKLERKKLTIKILISTHSKTNILSILLRKKIVSQNRLNTLLVGQIQSNKSNIKHLKKQEKIFDELFQNQNNDINNINNKIDLISNNIKNMNNIIDKIEHNKDKENNNENNKCNEKIIKIIEIIIIKIMEIIKIREIIIIIIIKKLLIIIKI